MAGYTLKQRNDGAFGRKVGRWWGTVGKVVLLTAPLVVAAPVMAAELPVIEKAATSFEHKDKHLETMFRLALPNALKQSSAQSDGTVYVGTGDIPAEWLRDSSAQVRPYLYFANDPAVQSFLRGVIARHAKYIRIDPYANAFNKDYTQKPIWERKYELDSLAYPIMLAWNYWKQTKDDSIFTIEFAAAMKRALDTMELEQDHANSSFTHPELSNNGKGADVAPTGMIWSGFRPSDDHCIYGYLIPSEMMAVVALGGLAEIESSVYRDQKQADRALKIRREVHEGIQKYGVVDKPGVGKIYAYEVDGRGNATFMDDANIPSLLAAPYLGYVSENDPIYQRTRQFILSKGNRNFASGTYASGIGSEHTPGGMIWQLALIMQALTTNDAKERAQSLEWLLASDPGDNLLHESFNPNNPKDFTRPDFGWPESLFSELVMTQLQGMKPLPTPSVSDLDFSTR